MKSYKSKMNNTLSTGENMLYAQKDFQLDNFSSQSDNYRDGGNNNNPKSIASYDDFMNLSGQYKGIDKTSCMSNQLDNKHYRVKPYKEETEKIETPLIMNDDEEKIYKELFKKKVRDKKKFLLKADIVLRKLYGEPTTELATYKKKTMFMQKLKIKYLKTFKENIDPLIPAKCQVRIYEVCYPLDSSILMNDQKNKPEIAIVGDQSEFKRIKQIIFDKKEQDYKYLLEEKFPEMATKAYFESLSEYYSSWLDSQNNRHAHNLALSIQESYHKDSKLNVQLKSNDLTSNCSKVYVHQLSQNAQNHIKSMPYFRRLNVYNINRVFPELIEMSVNQQYMDAVNCTPTFNDSMQGFKFLSYIKTKHVLNFQLMRTKAKLNFKNGVTKDEPDFSFGMDCLQNKKGRIICKRLDIYTQGWIENDCFFVEYYGSFAMS